MPERNMVMPARRFAQRSFDSARREPQTSSRDSNPNPRRGRTGRDRTERSLLLLLNPSECDLNKIVVRGFSSLPDKKTIDCASQYLLL